MQFLQELAKVREGRGGEHGTPSMQAWDQLVEQQAGRAESRYRCMLLGCRLRAGLCMAAAGAGALPAWHLSVCITTGRGWVTPQLN